MHHFSKPIQILITISFFALTACGGSSSSDDSVASTTSECSSTLILCVDDTAGVQQEYTDIQSAVDDAGPGNTVQVYDGNYAAFDVTTGGSMGNPLIIQAVGNNAQVTGAIQINNVDYVTLDGFVVDGGGAAGSGLRVSGTSAVLPASGLVIKNNSVSNFNQSNIYLENVSGTLIENNISFDSVVGSGIYLSSAGSDDTTIRGNQLYNNESRGLYLNADEAAGGDGLQSGIVIEKNIIYTNTQGGIYLDGVQNSTIQNNLVYGNGQHALRAYLIDAAAGPLNLKIINNTFLIGATGWAIRFTDDSGGHVIFNNILVGDGSIDVENTNLTTANNLVTNQFSLNSTLHTLATWQAAGYGTNSQLYPTLNLLFTNPGAGIYSILPGSLAEDNGVASITMENAPTDDIINVMRPQGGVYDIGAYENIQ